MVYCNRCEIERTRTERNPNEIPNCVFCFFISSTTPPWLFWERAKRRTGDISWTWFWQKCSIVWNLLRLSELLGKSKRHQQNIFIIVILRHISKAPFSDISGKHDISKVSCKWFYDNFLNHLKYFFLLLFACYISKYDVCVHNSIFFFKV